MTDDILKESRKSSQLKEEEVGSESTPKKPRTSEDFYLFCKFILEYENYDETKEEELHETSEQSERKDSESSSKSSAGEQQNSVVESSDDDSYDLVTCFCQKPFAGRPMIECSSCLTWIHLRCAKVKKSEIPDVFICSDCREHKEIV
ncbi:PHD finger protein 23B-like [Cimex lectularius]|uniref:Zinc finger PHD-type domain-containing protein n=1 Tax=Cimex lectularius TaxID=79782 RepID=A0A8I6RR35_CIMLE|nr:PHD finger protein 23B-like [Cimex lectularius]